MTSAALGSDSQNVLSAPQAALDFYDLSIDELSEVLKEQFAQPSFRAKQLYQWIYQKRVTDLSLMSNIRKDLRDGLEEKLRFPSPKIKSRQISNDGSRKYLFEVDGGDLVESVMIKQPSRMTLCVSSQVGCGFGCAFCRTGTMGLKRNLRTSEILQQVLGVIDDAKHFGDMFTNMVFMGMGEPLHNYDNVIRAIKILGTDFGLGFSARKITVSTVGLVPAIEKFAVSGVEANLAVSLNATTDEVRSKVMPVNRKYPLSKLLGTLKAMPLKPRKRITIEYVMLSGVNDTQADMYRLAKLLRGLRCKVNLIPYNDNAGLGFESPPESRVKIWQNYLNDCGFVA
ncbi:MAG: 23S rRNA (adenine(2503)-C(2))-methyltransferase RlmN, partial [Bdellovibrionales bacterium]|nr:23S rRNA (adenine(2503)-C(2))-methyltransferase RlmN [Bdellovibrionales bacterium]